MRKFLVLLLVFSLLMGGLVAMPSPTLADHGRDKKIPPGQAKKYYLDLEKLWDQEWDELFAGLEKRLDADHNKLINIKFLTRAQVAYILAQRSDDFADFADADEILAKVVDSGAIQAKYRKAVAYVISEDLMTYKELPNGKINFQPNKAASFSDLTWLTEIGEDNKQRQTHFSGTVRFRYSIGTKTWVAVETDDGILRTAYFTAGSVPGDLEVGVDLTVKVQGYRIIASSLTEDTDVYSNLTLSLITDPLTIRVDDEVTFTPLLTNNSANSITLQNVLYRFGIKKVGATKETLFTGSHSMTIVIPAQNTTDPVSLVIPSQEWTPASTGNYVITRAQLRVNNGEWHDINYEQPNQTKNLLSVNQSNIESSTSGFSPYGHDTYAGATLKRDTEEDWQGQASLRVTTNGINPWQGVNAVYNGSRISGKLTYSFYIKGASGVPLRVKIYDNTNDTYPSGGTLEFTGTGSWQRKTVTFTPTDSTKALSLQVTLDNDTTSTVLWLDGLQLEQGSSATAWIVGGSTGKAVLTVIE